MVDYAENLQFIALINLFTILFFSYLLYKKRLVAAHSVSAWVTFAFILYFVINPFFRPFTDDLSWYTDRINASGGSERMHVVTITLLIGISSYYLGYLIKLRKPVATAIKNYSEPNSSILFVVFFFFVVIGLFSLFEFRTMLETKGTLVVNGRFTQGTTGWAYNAHEFLFFPIVFFILSKRSLLPWLGYFLAIIYLALALPHAYSRFATVGVAIILLLSFIYNKYKPGFRLTFKDKLKVTIPLLCLFLLAAMLQVRGHLKWDINDIGGSVIDAVSEIPNQLIYIAGAQDTSMLGTLFLESYYVDSIRGYDYGVTLVNYLFLGWIPSTIFPDKYFLISWAYEGRDSYYPIEELLKGGKSTVIGDFYKIGGNLSVFIGMLLFGYYSKKVDIYFTKSKSILFKSMIISNLGVMWIVVGSSIVWGLMNILVISLPFMVIRFLTKIRFK